MKRFAIAVAIGCGIGLFAGCKSTPTDSGNNGTNGHGSDAMVWQVQPGIDSVVNGINSLTFGGNTFVAVGGASYTAPARIFTSPDAVTWTMRIAPTSATLYKVIWGNNMFVAVGDSGTIVTSTDGATWTLRYSDTSLFALLSSVVWGANKFIAYGYNEALTSPDGIAWTKVASNLSMGPGDGDVTWGNNRFVAVNSGGIYSSTDGLTWSNVDSTSDFQQGSIIYADTQYVAAGYKIKTSREGVSWTTRAGGFSSAYGFTEMAWGNGKFVFCHAYIYTSLDGRVWNMEGGLPMSERPYYLAYGAGKFVAMHLSGRLVFTSAW